MIMAARTQGGTLNGLIEICRDGARGFRVAADHVADPELKRLFTDMSRQHDLFATELLPFAQGPGGDSDMQGTTAGALHRGWMRVKDAMTTHDERAVLAEAIRGEKVAASRYADAVMGMLPPNARPVIERQYAAVREVQRDLDALLIPCA
jgi:uncharacterized protein (TIGR02284 family)